MMNLFRANLSAGTQTNPTCNYRSVTRLLAFAAVTVFGLVSASEASAACSGVPTLSGRYGVLVSGGTTAGVAKVLTGTLTFDTSCNATGLLTIGENGTVNTYANVIGSYTTNVDGTLSLSLTLPNSSSSETYDIGYSPLFGEALGNESDGTAYATIDLKPQVATVIKSNPVTNYSNATIKGNWVAVCSAAAPGLTNMTYFTIDGSTSYAGVFGNMSGTQHINLGSYGVLGFASHYAVMADGSFGGSMAVAGQYPYGFTGSVSENGNELQYNAIYGSGVIEACIAKRVS